MIKVGIYNMVLSATVALILVGCGAKKDSDESSNEEDAKVNNQDAQSTALACGENIHDNTVKQIRIKDLNLMVKSLRYTLGPGTDRDVTDSSRSIFDRYGAQFATTEGTDFGDLVADTLSNSQSMTGLLLASSIVGRNAALQCANRKDDQLCKCSDESSAAAMLSRALPFRGFCADDNDEYVADFVKLCKEDQVGAITALISSVAFLMRQ